LAILGGALSADPPRTSRPDVGAAFARAMDRDEIDIQRLEHELRALQPIPVPALFAVLDRQDVFIHQPNGSRVRLDIDRAQEEVVKRVLVTAPLPSIRRHLEMVAAKEPAGRGRDLGLWLLGEVGAGRDFELLVQLAAPLSAPDGPSRATVLSFGNATEKILARDPSRLWLVFDLFQKAPRVLRTPLIKAIERLDHEDALILLARMLGRVPEMDALILNSVARRGSEEARPVAEEACLSVRKYLRRGDEREELLAIAALGKIEDYDSVSHLMQLVEDGDKGQKRAAFSALRDITGLSLRFEVDLWSRWYEGEMNWWKDQAQTRFSALAGAERSAVTKAINEISLRRMHRHDLARELLPCLERREPEIVILACRALGLLSSRTVVPDLVRHLDARHSGVRGAAWETLRHITHLDLPPEAGAWEAVLAEGKL